MKNGIVLSEETMKSSTEVIEIVQQQSVNNNINKADSVNCRIAPENEKETEMEMEYSVANTESVPATYSNNPGVNLERQDYFSSFYKETLWPSSNVILYELVLPGSISLQLDMNKLIPRVMAISDKKSKCSVSELLHTIVTLTLGKKSMDLFLNKYLFSAMFKIGCENNSMVSNLLQKFMVQIIRYLSSKSTFDTHIAVKFLEILFQCLNYESNFVVKDYISMCIKEFLQSLLNLLAKQDRQNSVVYHYTVQKIINLATYPSYNETLTAAFAFNHLFTLCLSPYLNMIVPNKYWLEFLHSFLMNLEKCNEEQVERALCHIKDTICARTSIFNAKFLSRRKPSDFQNEKLEGAVTWLFEQCGNTNALLRYKCMNLFEALCEHVSNIKSTKVFVDTKIGVKNLNKIALKGFDCLEETSLENLKAFARTLDFYTWIFDRKMSTPEVVFTVDKNEKDRTTFLNIFADFVSKLVNRSIKDAIKTATTSAEEAKEMLELFNSIVLKIFPFISSVFVGKSVKNFIKNMWNDNLCLLVSRFTLCPWKLAFTEQSLKTVNPVNLETFFSHIKIPPVQLTKLQKNFFVDAQEEIKIFANMQHVLTTQKDLFQLKYFVNSITMLKNLEFINFEKQLNFTIGHSKEKITNIFQNFKSALATSDLREMINTEVIEYFTDVLNFFLLSYKPELVEFMINLISSEFSSTNGALSTVFFDTFKQPILVFLLKKPMETLDTLNTMLLSSPKKFLLLLESLIVYATSNPNDNTKILSDKIIRDCSCYKDLILDVQYHDWLLRINRLAILFVTDPVIISEDLSDPLASYVLEEFDKAESAAKRIEIVEGFIRCFIDRSRAPKTHVITMFLKLKEERSQAPQQLKALIEKLAATKSWPIWHGIVLLTCGADDHLFKDLNLVKHIEAYLDGMSSEDVLHTIESIFAMVKDTNSSPDERLDALDYFLIPFVDSCRDETVLKKFYEDNFPRLYDALIEELNESDVDSRKQSLVNQIASYRLFELMYCKLPLNVILEFRIVDPHTDYLNIFLLRYSLEVRTVAAKFDEERELVRLLHCSALNSYIVMVNQQVEKTFQNLLFKEEPTKNNLLWERIIDCEKKYEFSEGSTSRKVRHVNVMRKNGDKMRLSLEKDELNDHECMGMIVGILLCMHDNNRSTQTTTDITTQPEWMLNFYSAFDTDKHNVVLYLLRVMVNARRAFLPCVHLFFEAVVGALCSYLRENKINYLVRDILLMIHEAPCQLRVESEVEAAQKLVEALVQQARDPIAAICEYNVELIDKLVVLWRHKLKVPANLAALIQSDQILAERIILVLLEQEELRESVAYTSAVQKAVESRMYRWLEPEYPRVMKILGYIVSCMNEERRNETIKLSILPIFKEMKRHGKSDFCVHMLYVLFNICPSLAKHEAFREFIDPVSLKSDECRAECFEMFLTTMMYLEPTVVHSKLESMKFLELLRDKKMLPCVEVGFRIIDKLLKISDARQLLPYARVVEKYAIKDEELLDHKSYVWFFIDVYKKYANVAPEVSDEHTKNLLTLSEQVLINAVADPSDEMQEEILDFWRDSTQLTDNTVNRLKRLLGMFSLEVHSSYAQFLCLLMLDLTNKYSDNQKLLFGPLTPCSKENHDVVVPRKLRTKSTPRKKAARGEKSKSPKNIDDRARQKVDNADVKLSKRTFEANGETDDGALTYPTATRNYSEEYDEQLRAQKLEQENFVKFNRIYKETNLPDVEITQADVVATIESYARRCPSYAADLSVSIVCGILDHFKDTETYNEILESLADMCQKALKEANDFAPTAMEILYRCNCPFDVDDVLKIAVSMNLQSIGILILEKKSISYDYGDLYGVGQKFASELQCNMHLATLYRSIDEPDVVESIFKNWKMDSALDCLLEGSIAEREMVWLTAKDAYEEGFNASNGIVQDYCMEGMFDSLSKLSSWSEINETIEKTVLREKDYNSIWLHPKKEQVLPWIFKAQLQEKLENVVQGQASESEFFNHLVAWVNEKGDAITRPFGEELSLYFLVNGDSYKALKCLESCSQSMHEKWDVKSSNQRVLDKLRRLTEIEAYVKAIEKEPLEGVKELMHFWETNVPKVGDDMADWNIKLNYRLTFVNLLTNWLKDVSMDSGIVSDLDEVGLKQRLHVNDLALQYKNTPVARKQSRQIKQYLDIVDPSDERFEKLLHWLELSSCHYSLVKFERNGDAVVRMFFLTSSWESAHKLCCNQEADISLRVKSCHHMFKLTKSLRSWILDDVAIACQAAGDEFIARTLETDDPKELVNLLFHYSFNTLKDVCEEGDGKLRAESYAMFAEYCQKLSIDIHDRESALQNEFVFSLLQAMSFGSTRAARYFPCLLKQSIYQDCEMLARLFKEKCKAIPSRMLMDWQEEVISHLTTPLAPLVFPIVKRLCNDFPSSIIIALQKVRGNPVVDELYKSTFADSKYDAFFGAMEYLCQPEEHLRRRLQEIVDLTDDTDILSEAIESMLSKDGTNNTLQSPEFRKLVNEFRKELEKLRSLTDITVAKKIVGEICTALQKTLAQRMEKNELTESTKLSYYSPFLNDFTERDFNVDVPVQYNALHQRPKIVKLDRFVRVLPSKSSSVVIKIVGSDGMTYDFLVKRGLDLRQNKKMQRIFKITNEILDDDLNCRKRHLSVNTYSVVPISTSTGLIQWIANLKSLEEIVESSSAEKLIIQTAKERYQEWINAASENETPDESVAYKCALVKYSPEVVSGKMVEISKNIKPNLMQQSFLQISSSLEIYFKMRLNFTKSYATMCLTHWLFGVGDRRMKNILLDLSDGDCFGINFNIILGAAAELPVPELVPIRLTAQIINFMKPLTERDLFGATMCHVLKALKNDSSLIIGCLEALLQEPIGARWLPQKTIETVTQKFRGTKPSKIMADELSSDDNPHSSLYQLIVNGKEILHVTARSLMNDHNLTPEQQVLCLLDQATDVNAVGRMWADWKCFV